MRFEIGAALVIAASLGLALAGTPAVAGDYGCASGECYVRVHRPDVYGEVDRPVVLYPSRAEVVHYPPVVYNRVRAVEVVPGSFNVQRQPALYGSYTRTVMVSPARTIYKHVGASTRTVREVQVVRPAQVRWETQIDPHGRLVKCKVVVPAVTRSVSRVVSTPARTVARIVPARYAQVQQPMLVSPPRTAFTYNAPVYQYVNEPMIVRPATREIIQHPPVIGYARQEVLLRRGGYGWAPAGDLRRW
jgi:hypothetical protein